MEFTEFNLHPDLLDGIDALNYSKATPIQEQAIPLILQGRDLIGCAQTGTGKTAAFILPIINEIIESGESGYTQALIIVPTRELANQIDQVVEAFAYFTGVSSMAIYGGGDGKSFDREKTAIQAGTDILIATPGRLIAHIQLGYVKFRKIRFLVLDEADRMLDMGFQPDILKIIGETNPERQSLLFSATMPDGIRRMAKTILRNPEMINIALSKPAAGVTQRVCFAEDEQKIKVLADILKGRDGQRIIIFASSRASVSKLYRRLSDKKFNIHMVSSDLEQEAREKAMLDFRNRAVDILVATDVLSRGIDVDDIEMVVNFDVPHDAEDYVHRVGRTARAGRTGEALTFVTGRERRKFLSIERLIGQQVQRLEVPGLTQPEAAAADHSRSSGQGRNFHQNQKNQRQNQPQNQRQNHPPKQGERSPQQLPRPEAAAAQNVEGEQKTEKKRRRNRPRNRRPQQPKPEGQA